MTTLMTIEGLGKIVAIPYEDSYHHPGLDEDIKWKDVHITLIREDNTERELAIIDWEDLYGLSLIPYDKHGEEYTRTYYQEGNRKGYYLGGTNMELEEED